MRAAQKRVEEFVRQHHLDADVTYRLLDLASEVGELAKAALKATSYGAVTFRPDAAWREELADVLFSLVCLANATGIDLKEALNAALRKYSERLSTKGDAGSGR